MRNRIVKSKIKTDLKRFLEATSSKEAEKAQDLFVILSKTLDSAQQKGVVHKNTVARKKSRMAKRLNALKA